jgi:hypothetical protein
MGRDIRCPHCGETFVAVGDAAAFDCAACGKPIDAATGRPGAPGPRPASLAAVAAAAKGTGPSKRSAGELLRTCPACGGKLEPKERNCTACGASYRAAKAEREEQREAEASGYAVERAGIHKGVLGGVLMMVAAAVWFVLGWTAGTIFFYPPILFVIGLYAVVKGLATGNYAGKKPAGRRRRA